MAIGTWQTARESDARNFAIFPYELLRPIGLDPLLQMAGTEPLFQSVRDLGFIFHWSFAPEGRPLGFLLEAGVVGGDALGMAINEDLFNRNLI